MQKAIRWIWMAGWIVLSVVLDQLTKVWAVRTLTQVDTMPLWNNILHFTYVENRGAAFGMLAEHRWVFMAFSLLAIFVIPVWVAIEKPKSLWVYTAAAFIVGGGIGNMIDRIWRGFVVDFIDVRAIRFYVFNVADSFVCVGCVLLLLCMFVAEARAAREKKRQKTSEDSAASGGASV